MRVYSILLALVAAVAIANDASTNTEPAASAGVAENNAVLGQMVNEIEQLKSANTNLESKYQKERDQVAALLSVVDELKVASKDMGAKHDQVVALEQDLEALRKASQSAELTFKDNTANLEKSLKTVTEAAKKSEDERQKDRLAASATLKSVEAVADKLKVQLNDAAKESAVLKKRNTELEAQVGNVQTNTATATKQLETLKDTLQAKVASLSGENKDLKDKVAELELQIHADQADITKLQADVSAAKKELGQIAVVEKKLKDAKDQITQLTDDLKKADVAINWQAVFSAYYDHVATAIENSDEYVQAAKAKTVELYDSHIHPTTVEALKHASALTATAHDLYKQHAAEHVDPLLDQVILAAQPHVEAHLPVLQEHYSKVAEKAQRLIGTADQRFRMTRKWCIGRLKKLYPRIAKYARQIVDFTIFLMVLPLIYAAYRIVVDTLYLVVYLATCCCCFGLFGRKAVKHQVAQPVSRPAAPAASTSAKEAANAPAPSSSKKGKKDTKKNQ
ncbi:Aste57867_10382 [Aphanomyces stellatus]|uniref:Aste57867_10382 protein n=1 Tax=Aphanomyces stellatus TaxID=120398 RepID=A0A485KQQ7_9STRA|nr:hypothetical protein As57867_010342 [Aphanomyces stellatus]VFT87256.1 Aste57867_10382 [Aphanomyces stellatus]